MGLSISKLLSMKTSPAMQKLITQIAQKHGYDTTPRNGERRLQLGLEDFQPLLLIFSPGTVCVAQGEQPEPDNESDGEWSGEWDEETDPNQEVIFHTDVGGWVPMYSTQRGICRFYARPNWKTDNVEFHKGQKEQQAEEAKRCEKWAQELREQGWLERGKFLSGR